MESGLRQNDEQAHPSYLSLGVDELGSRADEARALLSPCRVCPRECNVDRMNDELGVCKIGAQATVSSILPHHGEEPGLSGKRGAGTIFFGGCNLRCIFCQNYQISQQGYAFPKTAQQIADGMLELQEQGCHNLDLVSPTHVGPQVLEAIALAAERGLRIPVLYNSNGYDSLEMLRLFDGVADIYLPDLKYSDAEAARELSGVDDYPATAHAAIREMYRQVGDAEFDEEGVVTRGLIIRLLVLPHDLAGMRSTLEFIAGELSTSVWLSVMSQYYPAHRAGTHRSMRRPIHGHEYEQVLDWVDELGFETIWAQGHESARLFRPDFDTDDVFDGNTHQD